MKKFGIYLVLVSIFFKVNSYGSSFDEQDWAVGVVHDSSQPTYPSWERLLDYTDQSIENFQRGDNRGMFIVHSLEYIMGATDAFIKMWNENHPDDQRVLVRDQGFHDIFTHDEFLTHYDEYVIKQRILVSGSVFAAHVEPQNTLGETFGPVSLIYKVPPECIAVTSVHDAGTPVHYASLRRSEKRENVMDLYSDLAAEKLQELSSLDALVRYPWLATADHPYLTNAMNEVAFFSHSRDVSGRLYTPKLVGIFINHGNKTGKFDYDNAGKNAKCAEAAKRFAGEKEMPIIEISDESILTTFKLRETHDRIREFLDESGEVSSTEERAYENGIAGRRHTEKLKAYKLPRDELAKYGLKDPA